MNTILLFPLKAFHLNLQRLISAIFSYYNQSSFFLISSIIIQYNFDKFSFLSLGDILASLVLHHMNNYLTQKSVHTSILKIL